MNMDLKGFLTHFKRNATGIVRTNAGRYLTDTELRAYCIWGLQNGYKTLYELPEFETIEVELKLIEK